MSLDKWLRILAQACHYPTLEFLNLANLTKLGSEYNVPAARAGAARRSALRANGLD